MRIFIISDIHVDYPENRQWVNRISGYDFNDDILILAGDVTHQFPIFQKTLENLRKKFRRLFFVPGNHDLWINDDRFSDSLEKFQALIEFCQVAGIDINPEPFEAHGKKILIVPLFGWYQLKNETGSLYLHKPGEGAIDKLWSDFYYVKWPRANFKPTEYFLKLNQQKLIKKETADVVITFSHFLPRQETMFSENRKLDRERMKKFDRHPPFNFSQVAGSTLIEKQLRALGSNIHVYGHQHINRDCRIEGVRYVAHCLGYPEERRRGTVKDIEQGLKRIWP